MADRNQVPVDDFLGITPSALPRLARCLGGAALPYDVAVSDSMRRGTCIHAFLERLANGMPPVESLAQVPAQWREDCASIPLDRLPPLTSGLAEVAMAWSPSTGSCRVLGTGLSREEARARSVPGEMPMVVDWVTDVDAEGRCAVVADWKTGWQEQLSPTAENLQILTYGAVYLLATGKEEVHLYLCRPDKDRPTWDGPVVLDVLAAESHLERVRELVGKAQAARDAFTSSGLLPTLALGPWCVWCSARFRCPAQVGALVAVVEGDAERCVDNVVELTEEQAGALWLQLKVAEKQSASLRRRLEEIARVTALPLPTGETLAEVEEAEEEMLPGLAAAWLRTRYGEEVANAVIRPEGSWRRLSDALIEYVLPERRLAHQEGRAAGRAPSTAALVREARSGLRAARAVTRTKRMVVKPVKAQLPDGSDSTED